MKTKTMTRVAVTGLAFAFLACGSFTSPAQADDVAEIIAVKNSGWASRLHQSVKSTIRVGDLMYEGDTLDVMPNNYVDIAFDRAHQNILHIEGPTSIQLSELGNTNIDLKKGKIFALLEKQQGKPFTITTPTAVSAVRGTQFQVKTSNAGTETLVYKGAVDLISQTPDGVITGDPISLKAGQKSAVMGEGVAAKPASAMSSSESAEVASVIAKVDAAMVAFNAAGFETRIAEEFDTAGQKTKNAAEAGDQDGQFVF